MGNCCHCSRTDTKGYLDPEFGVSKLIAWELPVIPISKNLKKTSYQIPLLPVHVM